ncbi:hypothetical protein NECAME_04050 [Necator americanus]|uniref:Uncharacterized protein n=1 Tax=Necator americanus TaxID=51031 RepID=W2SZG8_NECAM|nr:hypothetical protein NECAME_04050 [Necator americanus]ETN74371.1 hypothetical protein NECAME_04050 [Necator americanus]
MSLKTRFRPPALFLIDDKTMPYIRDPSRECLSNLSHLPEGRNHLKTVLSADRKSLTTQVELVTAALRTNLTVIPTDRFRSAFP